MLVPQGVQTLKLIGAYNFPWSAQIGVYFFYSLLSVPLLLAWTFRDL